MLNSLHIAVDFASLPLRPDVFTIGPFGGWGPFALRWYSLSYIVAILGGWWLLAKMIRRPGSPMTPAQLDSFITWATFGVILGGRLGYVLFYKPAYYIAHPLEILQVWSGGMSFHGGLLGVLIALWVFGRLRGKRWLDVTDFVA